MQINKSTKSVDVDRDIFDAEAGEIRLFIGAVTNQVMLLTTYGECEYRAFVGLRELHAVLMPIIKAWSAKELPSEKTAEALASMACKALLEDVNQSQDGS